MGDCFPLLPDAHRTRSSSQDLDALRAKMTLWLGRGGFGVLRRIDMFQVGR
jgi:hypothetical protein